jgi:plasmid stabilization system protein ParE
MARVVYSARALDQLESAFEVLGHENPAAAQRVVHAIASAIDNLAGHPFIGRRMVGEIRELIISYGETGYIGLYRFVVPRDEIRILALRHQREIGYLP